MTLSFARALQEGEGALGGLDDAYAAGILIARGVMFLRAGGVLPILAVPVLLAAWQPLMAMLAGGVLTAA